MMDNDLSNADRIEQLKKMLDNLTNYPPPDDSYPSSQWWRFMFETLIAMLEQLEQQSADKQ